MIGVVVCEVSEVLRDVETPLKTFRRHKVLCHLDAVVDVPNLREYIMSSGTPLSKYSFYTPDEGLPQE